VPGTTQTPEQIKATIKSRFAKIASAPQEELAFVVGASSAKHLGYDPAEIDSLPDSLTESFAGVGNPLALQELQPGQRILDLGSGAGLDSILAARRVAPDGSVVGIDFSAEMVSKARHNARLVAARNVEFQQAEADDLPLSSESVDVVLSNGVFNLCVDKAKVSAELFRVLLPGGRIQMADILLEDSVTTDEIAQKGEWSD